MIVLGLTGFLTGQAVLSAGSDNRLQPSDLTYMGAFRLPDGVSGSEVKSWAWGGFALAYYPGGDAHGAADGYPGSLFGAGHDWQYQVSEISIPVPVISTSKNLNQLNTATTLQNFQDILHVGNQEMPRAGFAYLPKQGTQTSGKIYYTRGMHLQAEGDYLTHGWFELTLTNPQAQGRWYLDVPHSVYNTTDYMFPIPSAWAAGHTPGKLLATGRFRSGGWSGQGPALFAIGPWNQGNPPANGTALDYVTLLRYTSTEDYGEPVHTMTNYQHSDEWYGASWLTAGNKAAVIFVGTKGVGDCWYGDKNGPCLDCALQRGWWSTAFEGQIIFYDPEDLAAVAAGTKQPWEPQPYATLNVDSYLYHITSTQQWFHLGAATFDQTNGLLYVFEPYVDNDKPIVHVWKVKSTGGGGTAEISLNRTQLVFGALSSGTVTPAQSFSIRNSGSGTMNWTVSEAVGWLSCSVASGTGAGTVSVTVNPTGLSAGQYNGTIFIASSHAMNSPVALPVVLNVWSSGASAAPFGNFAGPVEGASVSSSIAVTGWVLDDIGVESVKLYRGEGSSAVYIGDAMLVEGARPDVAISYPTYPANYKAGWGYMLLTHFLPNGGNGTFVLSVIARDVEGNETRLGSHTILGDNIHAVKPFGAIDTPSQGGLASGGVFVNWGWVLTPQPNKMATNGSTINVWVDGLNLGHPAYNLYREDIATLFPSYANSNGAVGYFSLNTTAYANGVHTIQWTATDSAGNTDGIGSRYFTITNSSSDRASIQSRDFPITATPAMFDPAPLRIKRGYGEKEPWLFLFPDKQGIACLAIKETQRLEVRFWAAGENEKGQVRCLSLPIGAFLDESRGLFYWQPGPGFVGEYVLEFLVYRKSLWYKKQLAVTITR